MKDIKKFRENIIQIRAHVSERERMAVLAEEAAELADSAQVLLESITESRRGGRRWVFAEYAREDLLEEAADVMAVLLCCFNPEGEKGAAAGADRLLRICAGDGIQEQKN